ncbi:MAG TPA: FlgD immunoglobulin-like domain containing protein [Candidatus Binatia bacterium]|nr:FlgD immunoglobulin-like domain containing protein [Candidatus Binatia bacterium]
MAQVLADGTGGAFFLFTDKRNGTEDVYVQRLNAKGDVATGWSSTGVQVAAIAGQKLQPQMTNDGSDGVIVVWADRRSGNGDIYAQRVLGNGTLAGGSWPSTGLAISTLIYNERRPQVCSDGNGGALISWELSFSNTDTDVYASHVTGGGSIVFSWSLDNSLQDARQISMATDGSGGFFVVYQDSSSLYSGRPQIYGLRSNGSGTLIVNPTRILLEGGLYTDVNPRAVADGSGGFQLMWETNESHANYDLRTQRYASNFTATGYGLYTSFGLDSPDYNVIPDGTGGVIVSWQERFGHSMINRASANGAALGWPVDLGSIGFGLPAAIASDGSGGAIEATGNGNLYAQRLPADGGSVAHWGSGVAVNLNGFYGPIGAASDGAHGVIVGWGYPDPVAMQVHAQRIDRFGALANPEPAMSGVTDVRGDQGGHVRLAWNASYLDADPYYSISSYYVWRQAPASLASAAIQRGARWVDDPASLQAAIGTGSSATRLFRHSASSAYAWEFVASQSANGSTQYTFVAPTTRDSLPNANPRTSFMVEARWTGGDAFWDSAPDSGYSVDNLAPGPPAQLAARWYSGTSVLSWAPNLETDLYGYRVYRGTASTFTPGPSNRVASPPDTGYVDAAGAAYWYKVSAVDVHGNESAFATVLPQGVNGVPPGASAPELVLAVASRNPGNEAMLRIDLTRSGPIRLALYDAAGHFIRDIASGETPAGTTFKKWDGRTRSGAPAPSGLYFARLEAEGRTLVRRIMLVR